MFCVADDSFDEIYGAQSLGAGEGFVRKSRYLALKHPTAAIISDGDIFNILYGVFMPVYILLMRFCFFAFGFQRVAWLHYYG